MCRSLCALCALQGKGGFIQYDHEIASSSLLDCSGRRMVFPTSHGFLDPGNTQQRLCLLLIRSLHTACYCVCACVCVCVKKRLMDVITPVTHTHAHTHTYAIHLHTTSDMYTLCSTWHATRTACYCVCVHACMCIMYVCMCVLSVCIVCTHKGIYM